MSAQEATRSAGSPRLAVWLGGAAAAAAVVAGVAWWVQDSAAASRDAPHRVTCQANLRQIGQAVRMYMEDYEQTLPVSASGRGDVAGLLEPYSKQKHGQGIWKCPSQRPFSGGIWTSSYGYNWQYLLKPGPDYPHNDWNGLENPAFKLSEIARPAATVMFVDHKPPPGNPRPQLWSYVVRPGQKVKDPYALDGMGQVDRRHRGQANVLFCDGHVKAMGSEINDEKRYWSTK